MVHRISTVDSNYVVASNGIVEMAFSRSRAVRVNVPLIAHASFARLIAKRPPEL